MATYLAQRRDQCLERGDDKSVRRTKSYLKDYDGIDF